VSRRAPSGRPATEQGICYTLHFDPPYPSNAPEGAQIVKHYAGRDYRRPERLADYALDRGARLTQVQLERGGSWVLAQTQPGGCATERQLKKHGAARRCEVYRAVTAYQAGQLIPQEALDRAGWDRASEHEQGLLLEIFGIEQDQIGTQKVTYDPPRPFIPQPAPEAVTASLELDAVVDALIAGWTSPEADAEAELEASA
jgi:hypothetical protein